MSSSKELKILLAVPYYERPKMVLNALRSFEKIEYNNYEIVIVDDGSVHYPIDEILKNFNFDEKIKIYNTKDSIENKNRRGSIHGKYMNIAMKESDADIFCMICDDDAITPDYFSKLNKFYIKNPDKMWSFCHIIPFDPMSQIPCKTLAKINLNKKHWDTKATTKLNLTGEINPYHRLDATQVSWRASVSREQDVWLPEEQTKNLDAYFYRNMYNKVGGCVFNGALGVYKGFHSDQLGNRNGKDCFLPKDSYQKPKYFSICAILEKEENNLSKWLDYNIDLGVDHFYFYDKTEKKENHNVLKKYYDLGFITLKKINKDLNCEKTAYQDFLLNYGESTFWSVFLSVDEYIRIESQNNIVSFMNDYVDLPGLSINYLNVEQEENKNIIKSIFNPRKVSKEYIGLNNFKYDFNLCYPRLAMSCDENRLPLTGVDTFHEEQYAFNFSNEVKTKKIYLETIKE
jgi:glycosyltransferase involved in cell wall biosynthesis